MGGDILRNCTLAGIKLFVKKLVRLSLRVLRSMNRIIFCKKIEAVLVHTDTFFFSVKGERAVEAFGHP